MINFRLLVDLEKTIIEADGGTVKLEKKICSKLEKR